MDADTRQFLLKARPVPWYRCCGYSHYFEDEKHVQRRCGDFVLLFMLRNTLYFSEDGRPRELTPGEWYFQLPELLQSGGRPSPGAQYFYIHFEAQAEALPDTRDSLRAYAGRVVTGEGMPFAVRGTYDPGRYLPVFDKLHKSAAQPWERLRCQSLFLRLLDMVSQEALWQQSAEHALARQMLDFMAGAYTQPLDTADFEAAFHYTYDYLRRFFKREYGVTPLQYVNRLRNEAAKELLSFTSKSLSDIAFLVGYPSEATFFKAFKREEGVSPRAWRGRVSS